MKRLISYVILAVLAINLFHVQNVYAASDIYIKTISDAQWDNVSIGRDGIIYVQKNGLWGMIDSTGKVITEPK